MKRDPVEQKIIQKISTRYPSRLAVQILKFAHVLNNPSDDTKAYFQAIREGIGENVPPEAESLIGQFETARSAVIRGELSSEQIRSMITEIGETPLCSGYYNFAVNSDQFQRDLANLQSDMSVNRNQVLFDSLLLFTGIATIPTLPYKCVVEILTNDLKFGFSDHDALHHTAKSISEHLYSPARGNELHIRSATILARKLHIPIGYLISVS